MASFLKFLFGSKPKVKTQSLFTPQQNAYQSTLLQGLQQPTEAGLEYLLRLLRGDSESFDEFADPEMRRFQEEILPMISERFAGLGALNSSGFQNATVGAGRQLSENLARLKAELKQGALSQLSNFGQQGLQQSQTTYQTPGSRGLLSGLLQGGLQGFNAAAPYLFTPKSAQGPQPYQQAYNAGVQL